LLTEGPVSNQGSNPALITFFKRKEGRKGGKGGKGREGREGREGKGRKGKGKGMREEFKGS
jgi:hypothetical protein